MTYEFHLTEEETLALVDLLRSHTTNRDLINKILSTFDRQKSLALRFKETVIDASDYPEQDEFFDNGA